VISLILVKYQAKPTPAILADGSPLSLSTSPSLTLSLSHSHFHTFTHSHFHKWLSALTFYISIFDTLTFSFTLSHFHFHRWLSALTFYVSIFDTMAVENPADLGIEPAIATMLKETVDSVWELGLPWKYEAGSQCDLCMCNC